MYLWEESLVATVTVKFCVVAECGACKYEVPFNAVVVVTPELLIASASKVPSKYKCLHCCVAEPKSKVSSSSGTRLEANSPPTTMSSVTESPSLTVPPRNVTIPINYDSPLTNNLSPIETAAPTVTLFSIPTPPSTIKAPVSLVVESVVSDIVIGPTSVPLVIQLKLPLPSF